MQLTQLLQPILLVPRCLDKTRDDKRLRLFQPAWLIRCLIHRLDQFPASLHC